MPRKAKPKSSQSAAQEPAVPPIRPLEQDPYLSPIGRDAGGHFARGNAGGPGNPHSRHCAYMLSILRSTIDDTKLKAVIQVLYERALEGDMGAIKLVLAYSIGKPAPAPNPDGIERDEWNRLEEASVQHKAVTDLLNSLPSPLASDLVRTTWQVKSGAFADNLARQLMPQGVAVDPVQAAQPEEKPIPAENEPELQGQSHEVVTNFTKKRSSLPNGNSATPQTGSKTAASPTTNHSPLATPVKPANNHSPLATPSSPATRHSSPATHSAPIPNGKSATAKARPSKRNRLGKEWLEPIAREVQGAKKDNKKRARAQT
jgi:hypothetical protein